jgi:hypothetical protein
MSGLGACLMRTLGLQERGDARIVAELPQPRLSTIIGQQLGENVVRSDVVIAV